MDIENNTNHYYQIKSKDRRLTENELDFEVQSHRLNHVRSFKIKKVIIPFTWYPINSNNNQLTIFKTGDTQDRTITISPGDYSLSDIKTTLKTELDGLGGPAQTYTITDNTITHKLTITQNSSTFIIRGSSSIRKILGLSDQDTTALIAHESPNVFNLSGTNTIEIYSNQLTKYDTRIRNSSGGGFNLLCVIPTSNFVFGNIVLFEPEDYIYDYHPKAENDIDLRILDEDGNILGGDTRLNGQEWEMFLQFHTTKSNNPNLYNRKEYRNRKYAS